MSTKKVKLKSLENGKFMQAEGGRVENNSLIYCTADETSALIFEMQGPEDNAAFRVAGHDALYLSYRSLTGAVKLYDSPDDAYYKITNYKGYSTIYNKASEQYMWVDSNGEPYITAAGNPELTSAHWNIIEV